MRSATSDDALIWQFAGTHDFTLVSKDLDFYDRSILQGGPQKVIWLRTGNCSTRHLEAVLRKFSAAIHYFHADPKESLLILP